MAWRTPAVVISAAGLPISGPENSRVAAAQNQMLRATREALAAVATDVRNGLRETVGADATISEADRVSMIVSLPDRADPEEMAEAIDLENIESWCEGNQRLHIAIGPWYSTKDVDQVVLGVTKVLHVLLGMHAEPEQSQSRIERWLSRGCYAAICGKFIGHW